MPLGRMTRSSLEKVISYPRLHVCLFDLGNATPRRNGGAGFTLAGLPTVVEAHRSERIAVSYSSTVDRPARMALSNAIQRLSKIRPDAVAQLRVVEVSRQHIGLGSKTALVLGALKAIDLACDLRLAQHDLQVLSGRGGTSGIGINTFFTGGFVIDGGHSYQGNGGFLPSRFRRRFDIPAVIHSSSIPDNWRFHLLLPAGRYVHGAQEFDFFKKNTPIPVQQVFHTIALAYHGLAPAVAANDLRLLRDVLTLLHHIGFKSRELRGQTAPVNAVIRRLRQRNDCAVGLSSMGPLIYAVAEADNRHFTRFVESLCRDGAAEMLGSHAGRNLGYEGH
jgi:beta-ribofuranosylaminobenzene 5'-phosphate synthase